MGILNYLQNLKIDLQYLNKQIEHDEGMNFHTSYDGIGRQNRRKMQEHYRKNLTLLVAWKSNSQWLLQMA